MSDLVSENYARKTRSKIPPDRALKKTEVAPGLDNQGRQESDHTIHFSLMSSSGEAISSTQTINGHFGSGIVVEGTGVQQRNG